MVLKHNDDALILIIADESVEEERLPERLIDVGYRCEYVCNFNQAFALVKQNSMAIDLMIIATRLSLSHELSLVRDLTDLYLPVIVINEHIHDALLDDYQEAGIDSYMSLPVNFRLLQLKIRSALRMRQLCQYEIKQRQQLLTYSQHVDLEQEVAAKIYKTVLQSHYLHTEVVNSVISSMSLFNGDLLLVEKTPDNRLCVLLGDFTGHGLSASVGATPVADIFYGMVRKGFAILEILQEINLKLYKMLPVNMFLAATAAVLNPDSKTLTLITCGLPEHFLVNDQDGSYQTISAKNIPLGILEVMDLIVQDFSVDKHQHLYLMTDGVIEAENDVGEAFGAMRIIAAVCQNTVSGIDRLQSSLAEHTHGLGQKDDFSVVELICDVDNAPWRADTMVESQKQVPPLRWKSSMEFDIQALRQVNPVPVLVNTLMEIQGLHSYRQSIFLIISELFSNALDHGVLMLDSAIKTTPEGFMQFYELRQERLNSWSEGRIRLLLSHQPTEQGGQLKVKVIDSGDGFIRLNDQQKNEQGFSGRGVKLLETLCSSLTYHGKGNRVTATFDWRK